MWYRDALPHELKIVLNKINKCSTTVKVVTIQSQSVLPDDMRGLPEALRMENDKYMVLRQNPAIVDVKRIDDKEDEHMRKYAQVLLFSHWEDELISLRSARLTLQGCRELYEKLQTQLDFVEENCNDQFRSSVGRST